MIRRIRGAGMERPSKNRMVSAPRSAGIEAGAEWDHMVSAGLAGIYEPIREECRPTTRRPGR
ncbi:hypothetical protein Misp03_51180 [Microbispora sp. NBRC 16548]|nr:hypothetical protein Misp03_51180 [Microbispora sp. NBRC 16548]